MFAIKAGLILTPNNVVREGYVLVNGDKIFGISLDKPKDVSEIHKYDDCILTPGFIDIHTHGGFGIDVTYSSEKDIIELSRILPTTGVTAYMPSTVTDSSEQIEMAIKRINSASRVRGGSKILGIHLEGPYLNPLRGGAQSAEYMRKPSLEEFERFYGMSHGLVKRITIAPEIEGGIDFIREVIGRFGVKVSLGHSDATYEQTSSAIDAGANIITHIYNGMREFHHREPGIVGAALMAKNVYVEIIADLIHLHPATISLILKCKGSNKTILVTDATSGAGLKNGVYWLGPRKVIIKNGVARTEDGILAGSTISMIKAVQNILKVGFPLKEAIRMATTTPCNAMDLRSIGRISRGYKADVLIMNKQLEIVEVYIDGEPYEKTY
ncbi:MAG: N-acetylglucosamine-6-phosphate deacetylase [Candidatus Bathyarchaeia archaeon]|nr:N-acetylglucosamine-6-phosphate deacetylase [Candidatus Bathyarchaeota archaeon]